MKKRGFGEGRWNGFGGKVEKGETIGDSVLREIKEEAGIVPRDICKRGIFEFTFEGDPQILEVHFFSAKDFDGDICESEEMRPQWFNEDEVPFDDMWPNDIYWFPLFLQGKNFKAKFHFKNNDVLLNHNLEEVEIIE